MNPVHLGNVAGAEARDLRSFWYLVNGYLKHGATGNFHQISDDGSWSSPTPSSQLRFQRQTPNWILPAETMIRKFSPVR